MLLGNLPIEVVEPMDGAIFHQLLGGLRAVSGLSRPVKVSDWVADYQGMHGTGDFFVRRLQAFNIPYGCELAVLNGDHGAHATDELLTASAGVGGSYLKNRVGT